MERCLPCVLHVHRHSWTSQVVRLCWSVSVFPDVLHTCEESDIHYYKQMYGQRLWQRYGFERVLRSSEATITVARYIFENPLRRGLAKRIEDYPFLGSPVYGVAAVLDAVQSATAIRRCESA